MDLKRLIKSRWISSLRKCQQRSLSSFVKRSSLKKHSGSSNNCSWNKIFMNEPELYHYRILVKMLEIESHDIKELELNKLMIESTSTFSKQISLFSRSDIYYFENNMLFLNELKEFNEIKSFYLRSKIPAEHYSIRVAPLLIKWVGSTRRAENLFLQHPYSPQCLEKIILRLEKRTKEQDSDDSDGIKEDNENLTKIQFKYYSRIAFCIIKHLSIWDGELSIWK